MVTTLYCYNCPLLAALPDLPMVNYLNCSNCPLLTALPDLPMVTTLNCYNCPLLAALPALPMVDHPELLQLPPADCTTRPTRGRLPCTATTVPGSFTSATLLVPQTPPSCTACSASPRTPRPSALPASPSPAPSTSTSLRPTSRAASGISVAWSACLLIFEHTIPTHTHSLLPVFTNVHPLRPIPPR